MTNEMTNEEAIAIMIALKQSYINLRTKSDLRKKTVKENIKAYDMAIKALETIPKYKNAYNKGWDDGAKASYEHLKMCEEEQEPCEVESGKLQQAYNKGFEDCRQAVSSWLKQYGQDVLHGKYKLSLMYIWKNIMGLPSVNQQEPKYCDRNICIKNEYNGISCDECEVTKSQEKSGDLIQRQAVLDYIHRILNQGMGKKKSFEFIQKYVEKLPSVNLQEPKTGHWIIYDVHGHKACKCSECDKDVGYPCNYKYCPYCGRFMIKPQESEGEE